MKGLLWFDPGTGSPPADKIGRAAERYNQRFGRWPTVCETHPSVAAHCANVVILRNGITIKIKATRLIRPDNFLVGMEE